MHYKNLAVIAVSALAMLGSLSGGAQSVAPARLAGFERACPQAAPGHAACHVIHRKSIGSAADLKSASVVSSTPSGFVPADLQSAYNLDVTQGVGRTVAIVVAQDDPNAESDLAVYRAQFGLPPCTTANGCFSKVNQQGLASPLPAADAGWAEEISLQLDMVSAICPNCSILLVEATDATADSLGLAHNQAAAQPGVVAISNPYGGSEGSFQNSYCQTYYSHPGLAVVVSAGDAGFGASSPATCPNVTAVGGTTLARDASARGWSESAWSDGGSGCSAYSAKPAYQTDTICTKRMESDVAAVADPNTGVAAYDTYEVGGSPGWVQLGGTSASVAIIAGVYGLAAPAGPNDFPVTYAYGNPGALFDVTSGTNNSGCSNYECAAGVGYDGPTGNGTPNGVGAFQPLTTFSLKLSASGGSLSQGSSSTLSVSTTARTGVAQSLALSAGGLPAGVTATFQPATINAGAGSVLTLAAATGAVPGSYTITVSATGSFQTVTASYALTVAAVVPANTSTALAATPSPSNTGQLVTLNASVTAATGTPTGTVSFFDGAALLGTVALSGNAAVYSTSALTAGSHSLTASYSGAFGFAASISAPVTQAVYGAGPLLPMTFNSNPSPSTYQQPVHFVVKIASSKAGDPVPTGAITFSTGAGVLGTCTLAPLGTHSANCRFSSTAVGVGATTVVAVYGGDVNYPTETGTLLQTVNAAASNTHVEVSPKNSMLGTTIDLIAVVTEKPDRGAIPGGSVTFYVNGAAIGTETLNSGVAVLPYAFPAAGTFALTAVYGGSSSIAASTSNSVNAVIRKAR